MKVSELKKMIREYRDAECPKLSKMKKDELVSYALKKNIITEEVAGTVGVKGKKEKAVSTPSTGKRGLSAYAAFVKENKKPGMSMADVASMWKNRDVAAEVKPKVKRPTKEKIEEVKKEVVKEVIKPIVKRPSKKLIEKIAEEVPMTAGITEKNKVRMEEALNKLRDVERETRVRNLKRKNEATMKSAINQLQNVAFDTRMRNNKRRKEADQKRSEIIAKAPKFLYDKDVDMGDFFRKMKAQGKLNDDEIDLLYRLKYASNIDEMMKYILEVGKTGEFADFAKYYKENAKPKQSYEAVFKKYVAQKKKD